MDSVSEERLTQVHPYLAQKVRSMAGRLEAKGLVIRVVQGLRSIQEQDEDFAKVPPVTKARGGYSWHNFGLAVDLVPGVRGCVPWKPNWLAGSPDYKAMIAAGIAEGLVSGSTWVHMPDEPHFQLSGIPVSPTNYYRSVLASQGLSGVWRTIAT